MPAAPRTVLITGATDGLGLESGRRLAGQGHRLVLHGRDPSRLDEARRALEQHRTGAVSAIVVADLSDLDAVDGLAAGVSGLGIDVLVNNAGVFRTDRDLTDDRLDVRFVVNTLAPYRLTRLLLDSLPSDGRVVNLSSAAQAPVDLDAVAGRTRLDAGAAYAQSKLALIMWSRHLAEQSGPDGPAVIALNPGSLLATKMVKEGFGIAGKDIGTGADVMARAAVGDEFADAGGRYYDNDAGTFAEPHPDALDARRNAALVASLDDLLGRLVSG